MISNFQSPNVFGVWLFVRPQYIRKQYSIIFVNWVQKSQRPTEITNQTFSAGISSVLAYWRRPRTIKETKLIFAGKMCDGRIAGSSFRKISLPIEVCLRCRTRGCLLHWPHSAQAFGVARWSYRWVIYLVWCSCFAKCFVTVSFILTLARTLRSTRPGQWHRNVNSNDFVQLPLLLVLYTNTCLCVHLRGGRRNDE